MESQNVEYKATWKDEYLKWICGFANAQGGRVYIGLDDDGRPVGVPNIRKLLEDLPNKVQNALGIIVDVNLCTKNYMDYIEICVPPTSSPVSFHGEYHYRSGSTKQVLNGVALQDFLINKQGNTWDAEVVPDVSLAELDNESFQIFRREAVRSGRLSESDLEVSNEILLERLNLTRQGMLTHAAVMLFHRNQERWHAGCSVRIGRLRGSELLFQDEVCGSLFIIADRVVDLIYLKYLKASVSYQKDIRVEKYPYPRGAVREIIYNALIHSDWRQRGSIQVRIGDDYMTVSNRGMLPLGWSIDTLLGQHYSRAFNPAIANAFFRAGYVETWGLGIQKIAKECRLNGNPDAQFAILGNDVSVTLRASTPNAVVPPVSLPKPEKPLRLSKQARDSYRVQVLDMFQKQPQIHMSDISVVLGLSEPQTRRLMNRLQEEGLVARIHSNRAVWVLKR